jgi:hypothetical protein
MGSGEYDHHEYGSNAADMGSAEYGSNAGDLDSGSGEYGSASEADLMQGSGEEDHVDCAAGTGTAEYRSVIKLP